MQNLTILNSKEIKELKERLNKLYGFSIAKDYAYLKNKEDRIFIVNKDIQQLNLKNLILDKIGLYFAEYKNNQLRLSKEGASLLYVQAKEQKAELKNVVELKKEELEIYFKGQNLDKTLNIANEFVLLKYNNDIIGSAKYKDGIILNFLPKIHRVNVIA